MFRASLLLLLYLLLMLLLLWLLLLLLFMLLLLALLLLPCVVDFQHLNQYQKERTNIFFWGGNYNQVVSPFSFLIRALPPHRDRGTERVLPLVFALLLPLLLLPLSYTACVPFHTATSVYRRCCCCCWRCCCSRA